MGIEMDYQGVSEIIFEKITDDHENSYDISSLYDFKNISWGIEIGESSWGWHSLRAVIKSESFQETIKITNEESDESYSVLAIIHLSEIKNKFEGSNDSRGEPMLFSSLSLQPKGKVKFSYDAKGRPTQIELLARGDALFQICLR